MADVLALTTQGTFVLVFLLSFAAWARHRDGTRRDIALMFGSFGVPIAIGMVTKALGFESAWLAVVLAMAIVAQPFLALRLVDRFGRVDPRVHWAALAGLVGSWVLLVAFPPERPAAATAFIIANFGIVNAVAASTFIRGSRRVRGVSRRRGQFAALALGFLALAVVFSGVRTAMPALAPFVQVPSSVVAAAAAVSFYVAFVPPRALRRVWQLSEFHGFLQQISGLARDGRLDVTIDALLSTAVATVDGDAARVVVKGETAHSVYAGGPRPQRLAHESAGVVARVLATGEPVVTTDRALFGRFEQDLVGSSGARTVIGVPVKTPDRMWGVLLVTSRSTPLFPDDDVALLLLMSDQLAHALGRAEAEETLVKRATELARSNADLQQFAYVASHDLKEPLRMVASFVMLLQKKYEGQLDDKAQTYIGFAAEGATRMQELIDGLLEYARVDANPTVEDVPLDEVMEATRRDLATILAESKAVLECAPLPVVRGDRRQLTRVMQNLVSNAVKFRKPGETPRVRVGASEERDRWVVHVADEGIGIEPEHQDQIFVLFRRLNSRVEFPGNGIGLAVSQKIVRSAGGDLWVDSAAGKGSTFHFSIPKKEP